jgi:hypothetical protein
MVVGFTTTFAIGAYQKKQGKARKCLKYTPKVVCLFV